VPDRTGKKIKGADFGDAMTPEELKAKRLSLGFPSRNALAKALGVTKYAVEHWEYGRRVIPGWVPRFLQCLEHCKDREWQSDTFK
jgi:DNA-binding transcriptional regulator YiaG